MERKPRGERGNFIRQNMTMDPAIVLRLKLFCAKKQKTDRKDSDLSSVVQNAIVEYLEKYEGKK